MQVQAPHPCSAKGRIAAKFGGAALWSGLNDALMLLAESRRPGAADLLYFAQLV
jgi:hypothetical protein